MYVSYRNKTILAITDKQTSPPDSNIFVLKVPDNFTTFSKEEILQKCTIWRGNLILKDSKLESKNLKIAFIGVYKIMCGISTYNEALFPEIAKSFKEYKIFSEYADSPEDPNIIRCWKRGEPLTTLIDEIHKYDPDIILIQHEYGIFPVARHWLSLMSELQKYKTYVTMHSVYYHKDKTVCDAAIKNVIVHTNAAKNVLTIIKKIPGKVNVIPHFCKPCENATRYYNCYHSEHTIIQYGFGFKYKGWEQAIQIIAKLKEDFPDIFFTGLFSESPFSATMHDQYFMELNDEINKLKLTPNIALLRGYQSDETLDSYLHVNRLALFPYIENGEHIVFGCSGAARLAMNAGIPIITSKVPMFDDLEGVCPRANSIDEFCDIIKKLFKDWKLRNQQVETQNKFLIENSIPVSAARYVEVMLS